MTQIYVLRPGTGPTIRTYVLEKALLGPRQVRTQKMSYIQVLRPGSGHRIRTLETRFRSYVLDLCPRSQYMSQIQVLGLDVCPRENDLDRAWNWQIQQRPQIQVLGPRKSLGPKMEMSQIQVLRSQKGPRFRSQFLEKVVYLGPKFQQMSQIQVLCPRFMSQVLENVLDFDCRSQIQLLDPGK